MQRILALPDDWVQPERTKEPKKTIKFQISSFSYLDQSPSCTELLQAAAAAV
jgi:hypothetical protein